MKFNSVNFRELYRLTKPGIIYGNLLTAGAGFLLASKNHVNLWLMFATLAGTSLVIASACVFNNVIDRGIDAKMSRTKQRALVKGLISGRAALSYATILGLAGFAILGLFTNILTVTVGLIAIFVYVVLYGIAKRRSVHGTLVGSVAGAAPPVAGYLAANNHLDRGAIVLFLILTFWQMPHFYAIAMRRYGDYKAAKLPVLPIVKGMRQTKIQIIIYTGAFTVSTGLLTAFGYTGYMYLATISGLGIWWLIKGIRGFSAKDDKLWARQMFLFSLIVLLSLSVMMPIGAHLP